MKRQVFLLCALALVFSGCTESLVSGRDLGPGQDDQNDVGYRGDVDNDGNSQEGDPGDNGEPGDSNSRENTSSGDDINQDDDPGPQVYVRFVHPTDGATVMNPVIFEIEAQGVKTVEVTVDDWPLRHDPWDPELMTEFEYTLVGVDRERTGILFGYDENGVEIARDTIRFTVTESGGDTTPEPDPPPGKGTSLGTFQNTYYYVANEGEYSGAKNTTLFGPGCSVLTTVSASFASAACIEGTAQLADDRVINYHSPCSCTGNPCSYCWSVMGANAPWGLGSRNNALEPLISWAVDTAIIPQGTVLYVEEWDGMAIPRKGQLGGFTHDGCFRADDVGGAIKGNRMDIFAGTPEMWRALEGLFPTRTNAVVYKDSPRCAHLN